MRILSLHLYPLKSSAPHDVAAVAVEPAGFAGDRRWMVIDAAGEKVSARTDRALLRITADVATTDPTVTGLRLRTPGREDLALAEPAPGTAPQRPVTVFGDDALGIDAGDAAAAWLGEVLGRDDVRLVFCATPSGRALDPDYAQPGDHTGYADSYPVLLTSTGSLAQVNDWIAADAIERGEELPGPLPMARFRPNVVVDSAEPFAEEGWSRVLLGGVAMRVVKTCARCVLTTVDPVTLTSGKEPVRTLARHHRAGSKTIFGVNLVPDGAGRIAVGDDVVAEA